MSVKRHDSVRVLHQNVDLLAAMLSLAADSPTKAVWIEGFGVVKGAVVIELDGGNRRQSIKQGMLTSLQALVDVSGDEPKLRSMAAVRGSERGTEQVIYGFLSAARAVDVTLRIRNAAIDEIAASKAPQLEINLVDDKAPGSLDDGVQSEPTAKEDISDATPEPRSEPAGSNTKEAAAAFTWDDLAAQSAEPRVEDGPKEEQPASQRVPEDVANATGSPKEKATGGMSWGDLAEQSAAEAGADIQPSSPKASKESWAAVADMSEQVAARRIKANDLARGNTLEHPTLGDCRVLSILGEERVMVRPASGPSRKLTLKVFEVVATSTKGRYELRKRKR